jgi:flagellar motor protein MotB
MVMQQQQQQQQPQMAVQTKNPFNLTDEQMQAVVVAACTAAAISKPVQEKLANYMPQFLNEQGHRSMVGLAATGGVAAAIFYVLKRYA